MPCCESFSLHLQLCQICLQVNCLVGSCFQNVVHVVRVSAPTAESAAKVQADLRVGAKLETSLHHLAAPIQRATNSEDTVLSFLSRFVLKFCPFHVL